MTRHCGEGWGEKIVKAGKEHQGCGWMNTFVLYKKSNASQDNDTDGDDDADDDDKDDDHDHDDDDTVVVIVVWCGESNDNDDDLHFVHFLERHVLRKERAVSDLGIHQSHTQGRAVWDVVQFPFRN